MYLRSDTSAMSSDIAVNSVYMIICTGYLSFCIIGIMLFYSGITQRKSSLTMLVVPLLIAPLVLIDWYIWGYSLCYGSSSNRFIGDFKYSVLRHIDSKEGFTYHTSRGEILTIIHFLFNGVFKIICVVITFPGCIAERGRLIPMIVFLFFWSCIVYNPVTYWFWNSHGWLSVESGKYKVLDFAGGNCIHVVSGFTALAYSYILGARNPKVLEEYRSSNIGYVVVGTFFLLVGWCGFVGGCDFKFSNSSIFIFVNVLLSSSVAAIFWALIDYYFSSIPLGDNSKLVNEDLGMGIAGKEEEYESGSKESIGSNQTMNRRRKISSVSFCSGIVSGLVAITPAGGYIAAPSDLWKSIIFGAVGGIVGNMSTRLKYYFYVDDALDIFALHGVVGIAGSLLTGIFANKQYQSEGGWVVGHWIQLAYQLLGCVVTGAYVLVVSGVLLYAIDYIPGLYLRIDKDFNRRIKYEMKEMKNSESTKSSDLEQTCLSENSSGLSEYEVNEIQGTDAYEFNGEYSMDFMEFINALRPSDYMLQDSNKSYGQSLSSLLQDGKKINKRE